MMKNILCAVGASVLFYAHANQTQETFLKACARYDQGHPQEALDLYELVEPKTPSVLYNIASCYYALGNHTKALVFYRKAQKHGNAQLCKKAHEAIIKIQDSLQVAHDSHWYTKALIVESYVAIGLVQILFLALLILLIVCLWWRLMATLKIAFLSILLVMAGMFCVFDYWFSHRTYAVVLHDDVSVYAGPDKEYHKVATLRSGQEVKVVEESQSWYKVSFQEFQGWIEQIDLDRII